MGKFTREELEQAFEKYNKARIQSQNSKDWSIWASVFTEDALYIEHAYGEFRGRKAIEDWIVGVMAPFPDMTFPQDWVAFDTDNDAVIFQCQNAMPHPTDPNGESFSFPNWSRIVYAGDGLFSSEEDVYNPTRDAGPVIKAWKKAGGDFASRERVKMKFSRQDAPAA